MKKLQVLQNFCEGLQVFLLVIMVYLIKVNKLLGNVLFLE